MQTLLITGGAGFIGSNFVRYWLKQHPQHRVIVLDKLTYAGNLNNLTDIANQPNYIFQQGDINNTELVNALFEQYRIDTVVNFAAESHVDRSINCTDAFMQSNVMGTHNLLKSAQYFWLQQWQLKQHRFHQISTDEVFGSLAANDAGFTEQHPYQPNSPYAASKAAADHLVRAFHHTYGLQTTISHCSNNYGPYTFPEKLIPLCLVRMLTGQPIPIYGDGSQRRDWLHVLDHCRGIERILQKGTDGDSYNIGGYQGEMNNLSLVNLLCEHVDTLFKQNPSYSQQYPESPAASHLRSKQLITHVKDRLGHDQRYAINSQKIQQQLGFHYQITLNSGLAETVKWYLDHPQWWQTLLNKTKQRVSA